MGSKPTREAHMLKYGAPLGHDDADGGQHPKRTAPAQRSAMERLATPKLGRRVSAGAGQREFTSRRAALAEHQVARRMDQLFPVADFRNDDGVSVASEPDADGDTAGLVAPSHTYPMDWRRLPIPDKRDSVEWLYAHTSMERMETADMAYNAASSAIQKMLSQRGIQPVTLNTTRAEVRSMIRSPKRYGVLVDIIATKRSLLSGAPHDAAMRLYEFVEETYPIYVIFMAVGITDNRTKCVARDVFNSDYVTGAPKKLPFGLLDGQHMMLVHPKGDEGEAMKAHGDAEKARREEARRLRTCTPKYEPPPLPKWAEEARSRPQSRMSAASTKFTSSRPTSPATELPRCQRCWRHGPAGSRSASAATAVAGGRSGSRSDTAPDSLASPALMSGTFDDDGTELTSEFSLGGRAARRTVESREAGALRRNSLRIQRQESIVGQLRRRASMARTASAAVSSAGDDDVDRLETLEDKRARSSFSALHAVVQRVAERDKLHPENASEIETRVTRVGRPVKE